MTNEEKYECKRKKSGDVYVFECKQVNNTREKPKKLYCVFTTEGKSGGFSGLSVGAQYGKQTPILKCFTEEAFKKEIAINLGINMKNIRIFDE